MEDTRSREVPIAAVALGLALVLVGVLQGLFAGLEMLSGLPALFSNRQLDASVRVSLVNGLLAHAVGAVMALVMVGGGAGLLTRESWVRPWIVWASLAELAEFAIGVTASNVISATWAAFRFEPGVFVGMVLLLVVASPLVAALALLVLGLRGRSWLAPSSRGQWVAAGVTMVLLTGTVSYRAWRDDPSRQQAQDEAALSVEPGKTQLVILPTFDGAPLDASFEAAVKLTLDEHRTRTHRNLEARYKNGVIEVPDLDTGVYSLSLGIDANTANGTGSGWGMPGDFVSYGGPRWDLLRNGQTVRQEVPVRRVMRLLQPEDTEDGLARNRFTPEPEFRSPLAIAWEPVPGARTYSCDVVRRSRDGTKRHVSGVQGPNTTWTVELPPTKPGETYALELLANGKNGRVGFFEVEGADWRGWDYRFRITE